MRERFALVALSLSLAALAAVMWSRARATTGEPSGSSSPFDLSRLDIGALVSDALASLEYRATDAAYTVGDAVTNALGGGGMALSAAGLEAIKQHEAFSPVVYRDQAGLPTIGYGHKLGPLESFGRITEAEALAILARDVRAAEDAVNAGVKVPINQAQFDALVSFTFNVGRGAFRSSTLLAKLNAGDYSAVPDQIRRWRYVTINGEKVVSNGLASRRDDEAAMFSGLA